MSRSLLTDRAYGELRSAIIAERLAPGTVVIEAELVTTLGVSRTPVREALHCLELEGYLGRDEAGRLVVHVLTREELAEIFLVRELLEGFAARQAAARISDAELDRMEELLTADLEALKHRSVERLAGVNEDIHGLVLEACRNRALRDMVKSLRGRVYGLGAFAVGGTQDQRRFVEQHAAIFRLLRNGDGEGAEALVRRHLRTARDLLLAGLVRSQQGNGSHDDRVSSVPVGS